MVGYLEPLAHNFKIVDELGFPTTYFIRWAQQKQLDIGEAVGEERAVEIVKQFLTEHPLQAGNGIDLNPDGDLNNSPTISAKSQEILDQITTTQGSVLFRGASGWEALPPGTDTQYLKSGGPADNPVWQTPSGGGGGGSTPSIRVSSASYFASGTSLAVPFPVGSLVDDVAVVFSVANYNISNIPSGWVRLDLATGSNSNGAIFVKKLTASDITTGSVTFTMTGSEPAAFLTTTLIGNTVASIRPVPVTIRSSTGTTSIQVGNPYVSSTDLILGFAGNRGNSTNTFSGGTVITTVSNTNSGAISSLTPVGLGYTGTASFTTAGSGYYTAILGVVGP